MNRETRKRLGICLVLAVLLCAACGTKEPQEDQPVDYSGRYTDRQGTDVVYSELELHRNGDGTYAFTMGIYRTGALEGTAEEAGGTLHFVNGVTAGQPLVEGDITVSGNGAEVVITGSDFPEMAVGTIYRFPDGE